MCVTGGGGRTAVGGTVLWRSVNPDSIRPPETVGFPAGITQTCGLALKNTLAPVSRNASLPWLVKVSQNISASQCYTRREPDSEKDTFKLGLKPTAGFPPRGKNKMSIVCKHRHHGLPPPSSMALPALQLLQHLQKPQQKGDTTKVKPKVVCGEVSSREKSFQISTEVRKCQRWWFLTCSGKKRTLTLWEQVMNPKYSSTVALVRSQCWEIWDHPDVSLNVSHQYGNINDYSFGLVSLPFSGEVQGSIPPHLSPQMWTEGQESNTLEDRLSVGKKLDAVFGILRSDIMPRPGIRTGPQCKKPYMQRVQAGRFLVLKVVVTGLQAYWNALVPVLKSSIWMESGFADD